MARKTQPNTQKATKNETKDIIIEKKIEVNPIEFSNDPSHFDLINKKIRALKKKLRSISEVEKSLEAGKKINADQAARINTKPTVVQNLIEIEEIKKSLSTLDLTNEMQLIFGVFHYSSRSEPLAKFAQLLSASNSLESSVNYGKNLLYGTKEEPFPGTSYSDLRAIISNFVSGTPEQKKEPEVEATKEVVVEPAPQPEVQEVKQEIKADVPEIAPQNGEKVETKAEGEPTNQGEQKQEEKNFKNRNNNRRGNNRRGRDGNRGNRDGAREGGNRDGNRGNREGGNRNRENNREGGNRDGNREGNRGEGGNRGNRNQGNRNQGGNRSGFKKPQNDTNKSPQVQAQA